MHGLVHLQSDYFKVSRYFTIVNKGISGKTGNVATMLIDNSALVKRLGHTKYSLTKRMGRILGR